MAALLTPPTAIDQGAINNCVANAVCYGYTAQFSKTFDPNWLHGRRLKPNTTIEAALYTCKTEGNVPVQSFSRYPDVGAYAEDWAHTNLTKLQAAAKPYKIAGYVQLTTEEQLKHALTVGYYVVFSAAIRTRIVTESGLYRPYDGDLPPYTHAMSAWGYENGLVRVLNSRGTDWGDNGQCYMTPTDVLRGKDCWAYWFTEPEEGNKMRETKYIHGVSDGKALTVRADITASSDKVGTLANGEAVTVLDMVGDRVLVSTGTCGYISTKYLTDKPPDAQVGDIGEEPQDENGKLQWYLHKWGFGALVGGIDGKVGTKTKTALKQFQAAMGLSVDGICGPKTWSALKGDVIVPRITESDMCCTCGKYCDGMPNPCTTGVRILIERIWQELEKTYPGVRMYIANNDTPPPDGAIAGGQRCEKWNKIRGGASGSQHRHGTAADIYGKLSGVPSDEIRQKIEDIALKMNTKGGVGYGAMHIVHVDIRGNKARWEY